MFNVAFGLLVCEAVTSKETASHIFTKFICDIPPDRLWGPRSLLSMGTGVLGVKCGRSMMLTTHPIKCQGQEWVGAMHPLPLGYCMTVAGQLYFFFYDWRLLILLNRNSSRREMELRVPCKSLLSDNICFHCCQNTRPSLGVPTSSYKIQGKYEILNTTKAVPLHAMKSLDGEDV